MIDREKVIKGLECCIHSQYVHCPADCPYLEGCADGELFYPLLCDALELLKEHPQVIRCKDCKWYQAGIDIDGKPFTRCNGDVRVYGHTTPDWFCAYGEVKQE